MENRTNWLNKKYRIMKKTIIILFILASCLSVTAQENHFSISAVLNMCNVLKSGDFFGTTSPKPGLHAGIYHHLLCEKKLEVPNSLLQAQKRFSVGVV